jgi:hypothetical protein
MDKEVGDLLRTALVDALEEARRMPQPQNAHQTITLHHADPPPPNPWQTWVCASAALVMLVIGAVTGLLFLDLSRKYDRLEDYLQSIYAQAPHLRPEDDGGTQEN